MIRVWTASGILDELIELVAEGLAESFHVAMVNIGPGNSEQAFDTRSSHMLYIKQSAQFDPLRGDPRFIRLVERMGW